MTRTACRLLPLLTLLLIVGCESMKDIGQDMGLREGEAATVAVPFPQMGEPVQVVVTASTQDSSKQGVRLLRIGEFSQAAEVFANAVLADPGDHRSHFALGVAREMLANLADARKAYVTALSLNADEREYTHALNRIKLKLGETTPESPESP